jgi:hypothetical protein
MMTLAVVALQSRSLRQQRQRTNFVKAATARRVVAAGLASRPRVALAAASAVHAPVQASRLLLYALPQAAAAGVALRSHLGRADSAVSLAPLTVPLVLHQTHGLTAHCERLVPRVPAVLAVVGARLHKHACRAMPLALLLHPHAQVAGKATLMVARA